jgi:hypothetical protein
MLLTLGKKLVSDLLLSKDGFKMVFESDKVLLSTNGICRK